MSLGANVSMSSVLGSDEAAKIIKEKLTELGVNTRAIFENNERVTSLKTRVMAGLHQIVRFDKETKSEIDKECEKKYLDLPALTPQSLTQYCSQTTKKALLQMS